MKMTVIKTDIANGVLTIKTEGMPDIVVTKDTYSPETNEYAMLDRYRNKIIDCAALSKGPDGKSATPAMKYHAMREGADALHNGWNSGRGGEGANNAGLLVEALMRLDPTATRPDTEAFVKSLSRDEQTAMREADATVAPVVTAIKKERAAKKPIAVVTDDLKSKLATFLGKGQKVDGTKAPEPKPDGKAPMPPAERKGMHKAPRPTK
jgi:hypothetical protein